MFLPASANLLLIVVAPTPGGYSYGVWMCGASSWGAVNVEGYVREGCGVERVDL